MDRRKIKKEIRKQLISKMIKKDIISFVNFISNKELVIIIFDINNFLFVESVFIPDKKVIKSILVKVDNITSSIRNKLSIYRV